MGHAVSNSTRVLWNHNDGHNILSPFLTKFVFQIYLGMILGMNGKGDPVVFIRHNIYLVSLNMLWTTLQVDVIAFI